MYCDYLYPICDVINFEINRSFFMKSFFVTKKSEQKFKYLNYEKSFHFKGLLVKEIIAILLKRGGATLTLFRMGFIGAAHG